MLRRAVLLGLLLGAAIPASAAAAVQLVKVGDFSLPVYVTAPPGDTHRLFVVEQGGKIQLMVDGQKQAAPFLDITSEVTRSDEQGLLSMAFAPDYATSGKFYVYYTTKNCPDSPGCDEHVSEFTRSASNPNVANQGPGSERVLITIPHPSQDNHNGGQLQFGPDGDLYISVGDGGLGDDKSSTEGNAQRTDRLLGKLLRIDPFHGTPYSIPAGNPFAGGGLCSTGSNGGNCPEIWAYGLRNPWRYSFDRATGDLIIGDVGQNQVEEIDYSHPGQNIGANYGWPCFEGTQVNSSANSNECSPGPPASSVVMPVHTYNHSGSGFTGAGIIGGYVVRDQSIPELYGRYLYGDLSSSGSKGLRSLALTQPNATDDQPVPLNISFLSSFGEDAAGCVYAASVGVGSVWRIAPTINPTPGPCGQPSATTPPPAPDKTPPSITLRLAHRQHILKRHAIKLLLVVSEPSAISVRATVSLPRTARVLQLRGARRNVAAGKRATFRIKASKAMLRRLRAALRHRHSLAAKVTVIARDTAGNAGRKRHAVRLFR